MDATIYRVYDKIIEAKSIDDFLIKIAKKVFNNEKRLIDYKMKYHKRLTGEYSLKDTFINNEKFYNKLLKNEDIEIMQRVFICIKKNKLTYDKIFKKKNVFREANSYIKGYKFDITSLNIIKSEKDILLCQTYLISEKVLILLDQLESSKKIKIKNLRNKTGWLYYK
jgi:hypothetical protein